MGYFFSLFFHLPFCLILKICVVFYGLWECACGDSVFLC
jgi:hypothetical protein